MRTDSGSTVPGAPPLKARDEPPHRLVRPGTIRAIKVGFGAALALAVAGDLVVHHHVAFGVEGTFGFNAWYGLLTCVGMVVAAKLLGVLLKRPDHYYDTEVKE